MVLVAGWLGIISTEPAHRRVFAVIFGLGAGLVGDEVGLLLTLGNYYSSLTYSVIAGVLFFVVLSLMVFRRRAWVRTEMFGSSLGESLLHWGILIGGLSSLPFSLGSSSFGLLLLVAGASVAVIGHFIGTRYPHRKLRGA